MIDSTKAVLPSSYIEEFGAQEFKPEEYSIRGGGGISHHHQSRLNKSKMSKGTHFSSRNFYNMNAKGEQPRKKRKTIKPNWIYSEKSVGHDDINSLIEADEQKIPEMVFSDAIRRLTPILAKVENRHNGNIQELEEQRAVQKELLKQKKELQSQIDDLVQINDNDRETIIIHTKKIDESKAIAKEIKKIKKTLKPGQKIDIKHPFIDEAPDVDEKEAQIRKIKAKNIVLQEQMAQLDLELTDVKLLDLRDTDFLDLLQELEGSENPSYRRTHKLLKNLVDQTHIDEEMLQEHNQRFLRTRHSNLLGLEEARERLDQVILQEESLKAARAHSITASEMQRAQAQLKAKQKKKPQSLLENVQVNLNSYDFVNTLPPSTKTQEFTEDLSRFSRKTAQKENDIRSKLSSAKKSKLSYLKKEISYTDGMQGSMFEARRNLTYKRAATGGGKKRKGKGRKKKVVAGTPAPPSTHQSEHQIVDLRQVDIEEDEDVKSEQQENQDYERELEMEAA